MAWVLTWRWKWKWKWKLHHQTDGNQIEEQLVETQEDKEKAQVDHPVEEEVEDHEDQVDHPVEEEVDDQEAQVDRPAEVDHPEEDSEFRTWTEASSNSYEANYIFII